MAKLPSGDRIELVYGSLDMLILRTLRWGPTHGHGIAKSIERLSDEAATRPRDAHAAHALGRYHGEELIEQRPRGFARAALDASVGGDDDRSVADARDAAVRGVQEVGSLGGRRSHEVEFVSVSDQRGLEADAADVYAQERHTGIVRTSPWGSYESPV